MNLKGLLRPLPIVALALVGVGVAKVSGIALTAPNAFAAAETKAKPVPAMPPGSKPAAKAGASSGATPAAVAAASGAAAPVCAADDVASQAGLSAAEFRLLQSLQERRQALDNRERDIATREAVAKAAEQRIIDRTTAMKAVETNIASLLGKVDEEEAARVVTLVKVYEKMKPKDAARILEGLEDDILFKVASRMKPASMSLVMAQMNGDRARKLTTMLANADRTLVGAGGAAAAAAAAKAAAPPGTAPPKAAAATSPAPKPPAPAAAKG